MILSPCSECTLYTETNVIWYHDVAISWFSDNRNDVNDDYDDSLMMIAYSVQCTVYGGSMKDVVESLEEVEWFGISRQFHI